MKRSAVITIVAILIFLVVSCNGSTKSVTDEVQVTKDTDISQSVLKKPVYVRFKRTSVNKCTWDLSGSNVEEIIKIDRQLHQEYYKE